MVTPTLHASYAVGCFVPEAIMQGVTLIGIDRANTRRIYTACRLSSASARRPVAQLSPVCERHPLPQRLIAIFERPPCPFQVSMSGMRLHSDAFARSLNGRRVGMSRSSSVSVRPGAVTHHLFAGPAAETPGAPESASLYARWPPQSASRSSLLHQKRNSPARPVGYHAYPLRSSSL